MSFAPTQIFEEGTTEEKGENARLAAFVGAIAVGDLVKSTLGPKGMDKILQSASTGEIMVTNDGATILKSIALDNAAAKVLVNISKVQDDEVGDGTTSVAVLAAELLREAEKLVDKKIHPQTIIEGYRIASQAALKALEESAVDHSKSPEAFRKDLVAIARTTLSSKVLAQDREQFAELACDAVLRLKNSSDLSHIQIIKKAGGKLSDSYLDEGFILDKKIGVNQPKRLENAKILVANTSMDTDKVKIFGARLKVSSTSKLADLEKAEREKMKAKVEQIKAHGINCFINRQLIYNWPEQLFTDAGIMSIEHADFDGIERLALVTGGEITSTFDHPDQVKLGHCDLIEEVIIGEDTLIKFSGVGAGEACTIVLRGATEQLLDEAERSLHDALAVLSQTVLEPRTTLGGGCAEMVMAKAVEAAATRVEGKRQMAVSSFATALTQLPTILADNAGLDSGDLVSRLRNNIYKGLTTYGLDLMKPGGDVADMREMGVIESYKLKKAVVSSASEAAESYSKCSITIAFPRLRCSPSSRRHVGQVVLIMPQLSIAALARTRITKPGITDPAGSKRSENGALKQTVIDERSLTTKRPNQSPNAARSLAKAQTNVKIKPPPQANQKPKHNNGANANPRARRGTTPARPPKKSTSKNTKQNRGQRAMTEPPSNVIEVLSDTDASDLEVADKAPRPRKTNEKSFNSGLSKLGAKQQQERIGQGTPKSTPRVKREMSRGVDVKSTTLDDDSDCVVESVRKLDPKQALQSTSKLPRRVQNSKPNNVLSVGEKAKSGVRPRTPSKEEQPQLISLDEDSDIDMLNVKQTASAISTPRMRAKTPTRTQPTPQSSRLVKPEPKSPTPFHSVDKSSMTIDLTQASSDDSGMSSDDQVTLVRAGHTPKAKRQDTQAPSEAVAKTTPAAISARRCRERLTNVCKSSSKNGNTPVSSFKEATSPTTSGLRQVYASSLSTTQARPTARPKTAAVPLEQSTKTPPTTQQDNSSLKVAITAPKLEPLATASLLNTPSLAQAANSICRTPFIPSKPYQQEGPGHATKHEQRDEDSRLSVSNALIDDTEHHLGPTESRTASARRTKNGESTNGIVTPRPKLKVKPRQSTSQNSQRFSPTKGFQSPKFANLRTPVPFRQIKPRLMRDGVSEHAIKPTVARLKERLAAGEVLPGPGSVAKLEGPELVRAQQAASAVTAELRRRGIRSDTQYGHFWYNLMMEYSALAGSPVPMFTMMKTAYDDFQNEALAIEKSRNPASKGDDHDHGKKEGLEALLMWGAGDTDESSPSSSDSEQVCARTPTTRELQSRNKTVMQMVQHGKEATTTGAGIVDPTGGSLVDDSSFEGDDIESDSSNTAGFFTPEPSPSPADLANLQLIKESQGLGRELGFEAGVEAGVETKIGQAGVPSRAAETRPCSLAERKRRCETDEMSSGADETNGASHRRKRLRVASTLDRDTDGGPHKDKKQQQGETATVGGRNKSLARGMTASITTAEPRQSIYAEAWKKLNKLGKVKRLDKTKGLVKKIKAKAALERMIKTQTRVGKTGSKRRGVGRG
ncbi:putative T-complex protein 1 subunit beta [Paramyrothecium foliicola]|nr:putative T-complex protein 1 subunit beta [Paramyrothecium foliicola]